MANPCHSQNLLLHYQSIHPSKTNFIYRLMRILTHSGFFSQQNVTENELEIRYELTDASRLRLKEAPFSMIPFMQFILDPFFVSPWHHFSTWFKTDDPTLFDTEYGMTFYDYVGQEPKLNHLFNNAMTSDTRLVSGVVIEKCRGVFEGLESLVDVGGGTGTMAKAIAKSFPQLDCTVFDLPRVIAGLQGSDGNLKYVGGNMFKAIPPTDSILLKDDENCVKVLKKCNKAITRQGKNGKVIIIDMVMENEKEDDESVETKMLFDLKMMVFFTAKERNEKEWAKVIFSAGFGNYKVTPLQGLNSLIEVFA